VSLRIIRAHNLKPQPWKNGGGITTQIAVGPDGATVNDFDWRISMARVATDGPFSAFPGIDRMLTVLDGDGIWLRVDANAPMLLDAASAPLAFSGESTTVATLRNGPITDLNVMTRRGRVTHSVERLDLAPTLALAVPIGSQPTGDGVTIVHVVRGAIDVVYDGRADQLSPGDSLVTTGTSAITLSAPAPAHVVLVRLQPAHSNAVAA
jgi:uncharacterized protein